MKIKLAVIGVGNACAALIQGIEFYKNKDHGIGLLHPNLAGYHISSIEVVAAIDISGNKVGKDLAEAIKATDVEPLVEVPDFGFKVAMGDPLDGVIPETEELITPADVPPVDLPELLGESGAEIALCLLPSGADEAVRHYAELCAKARCAFINATPTMIANDPKFQDLYIQAGVPLIGDDLQDQIGATILHKLILTQMKERGVDIKESYALDVGGGPESLNTIHRTRQIKRDIKSESVASSLNIQAPIVAGTSDYVPHLGNKRNTMIWIVGKTFLGKEVVIDMKIQTEDGANGGSIICDIIRATKVALNQGDKGAIDEISSYGFKKPPKGSKFPKEAEQLLANYILGIRR